MQCPNCGSPIDETNKFCTNCGAGIPGHDGNATSAGAQSNGVEGVESHRKQHRRLIVGIIAAVVVVILVVVAAGCGVLRFVQSSEGPPIHNDRVVRERWEAVERIRRDGDGRVWRGDHHTCIRRRVHAE